MTIKEELKKKLEQVKKNQLTKNQAIDEESRRVLNDFLIPKFREIAVKRPTEDYLEIHMSDCLNNWWMYTSNIDTYMELKRVSYSKEAVFNVKKYAEEAGIKVVICEDEYMPNVIFVLDLS